MTRTLPGSGLTGFWPLGNNTYKDAMDNNLRVISALLAGSVVSRTTALPGSGTLGAIYIVPAAAPSNANEIAIWDGPSGSEAWVYLAPRKGWHLYVDDADQNVQWDGTDWVVFAGAGGAGGSYDLRFGFSATPTAGLILDTIMVPRGITIPANMVGSLGKVFVLPTATFDMLLKDDGTTIGTISVSTAGVFTFTTVGGTDKFVAVGSELSLHAPAVADATIQNLTMTILANI